jgi:mannose-1-phosphate guanylyltransferase/mannose-6-phosphate isomerase
MKIKPVILCGGEGTRLWPESRKKNPKQFIKINNISLLRHAINRVSGKNFDKITFCTNINFLDLLKTEVKNLDCSIVVEPIKKNTAPAILAALNDDNISFFQPIIIISADHIIEKKSLFQSELQKLSKYLDLNKIFIFGIKPSYAEIGYGYLKLKKEKNFYKVSKFLEKPNFNIAKKIIKNKNIYWNSGMFFSSKSALLNEYALYENKLSIQILESYLNAKIHHNIIYLEKSYFNKIKSISFDKAILEKSKNIFGHKLPTDWTDVGSWKQKWQIEKKDKNNNFIKGNVISLNVKNSYIASNDKLVVANNLNDILAVQYNDALYLADLKNSNIKNIYPSIVNKFSEIANQHVFTKRPWGEFKNIYVGKNFQVKELIVVPGGILSLQKHKFRSENWVVVEGVAKVTLNNKIYYLKKSQSIFIPKSAVHRIENPNKKILRIIEVQTGSYLGEDDIVRIKDIYGRS